MSGRCPDERATQAASGESAEASAGAADHARACEDAPAPRESLLDVACGTGIAARLARGRIDDDVAIVACDSDSAMIEVGRGQCPAGIDWRLADVAGLPFPAAMFDVCLCCHGLPFFDDRAGALAGMRRVLAPGGRLVASVWCAIEHNPGHRALAVELDSMGRDASALRRPFSMPDPAAIESLVLWAGFESVRIATAEIVTRFRSVDDFADRLAAGAPSTRRALEALDGDERRRLRAAVGERLRGHAGADGSLALPTRAHIVSASA
jgi:SAM-dependent methyltransferase